MLESKSEEVDEFGMRRHDNERKNDGQFVDVTGVMRGRFHVMINKMISIVNNKKMF